MIHRLFGEEPAADAPTRVGHMIGNVMGIALYVVLVWVVLRGFA